LRAGLASLQAFAEDKPHVGIAGVTLHKPRHISIIEDTNRDSPTSLKDLAGRPRVLPGLERAEEPRQLGLVARVSPRPCLTG